MAESAEQNSEDETMSKIATLNVTDDMEDTRVYTSFLPRSFYVDKDALFTALESREIVEFTQPTSNLNDVFDWCREHFKDLERVKKYFRNREVNYSYCILLIQAILMDGKLEEMENLEMFCSIMCGRVYPDDKSNEPLTIITTFAEVIPFMSVTYAGAEAQNAVIIKFVRGPIMRITSQRKYAVKSVSDSLKASGIHDYYGTAHRNMWVVSRITGSILSEIGGILFTQKEFQLLSAMCRGVLDYAKWLKRYRLRKASPEYDPTKRMAPPSVTFMSYASKPVAYVRSHLKTNLGRMSYVVHYIFNATQQKEIMIGEGEGRKSARRLVFSHHPGLEEVTTVDQLITYCSDHITGVPFPILNDHIYTPDKSIKEDGTNSSLDYLKNKRRHRKNEEVVKKVDDKPRLEEKPKSNAPVLEEREKIEAPVSHRIVTTPEQRYQGIVTTTLNTELKSVFIWGFGSNVTEQDISTAFLLDGVPDARIAFGPFQNSNTNLAVIIAPEHICACIMHSDNTTVMNQIIKVTYESPHSGEDLATKKTVKRASRASRVGSSQTASRKLR